MPPDRIAEERRLLQAYADLPNGLLWWERAATHRQVFGPKRLYSATHFYHSDLGYFEVSGGHRQWRYTLSEKGRARLAELNKLAA